MNKKLIYTAASTLDEAIKLLDENGNGFLPVVDPGGKLLGIITDGDLRRSLLNKTLALDSVINRNPTVEKNTVSYTAIKRRLREMRRRHMPVVDDEGRLTDVVVLDEFEFSARENWVVIMAGGLGSRLGSLTRDTPKPMLHVEGKPILQGIIERFKSQGFSRFILCVNYKSEVIEDYFGNGDAFGVEIKYTRETKRMGTAGALSLIDFAPQHDLFVVNGDVLTSVNFADFLNFHLLSKSQATMCIKQFSYEVPYACIEFDDTQNLLQLKEKPVYDYYINTGMYVLSPDVLKHIPYNEHFDMPGLFELLVDQKIPVKVYTINDYWLDIGRRDDFDKARNKPAN